MFDQLNSDRYEGKFIKENICHLLYIENIHLYVHSIWNEFGCIDHLLLTKITHFTGGFWTVHDCFQQNCLISTHDKILMEIFTPTKLFAPTVPMYPFEHFVKHFDKHFIFNSGSFISTVLRKTS